MSKACFNESGGESTDMLIYRRTSILESTAQTLVNTVNCVGVMGKGIAAAFKERDPAMFRAYKRICEKRQLEPGKLWLWKGAEQWVLNFPTKKNWRNPSRLEWIEAGLSKFVNVYEQLGIREISFPRLGCGNGGLNWDDVRPLMERYLSPLRIPVYVHDHTVDIGLPEHMEEIAKTLRAEYAAEPTFTSFVATIRRALELTSDQRLVELRSLAPFNAHLSSNAELSIGLANHAALILQEDDLRGIWVALLNGLVTREKAGWSRAEGGESLISLLSILPQVRPVEIQRSRSPEPELAIELRPTQHRSVVVPGSAPEQLDIAWG